MTLPAFLLPALGSLFFSLAPAGPAHTAPGGKAHAPRIGIWETNPVFEHRLKPRPFAYGFTTFPFAATPQAQADLMDLITANGTIYAEHFDDAIPWRAALRSGAWPQAFVADIEDRLRRRRTDRPLLLALTPLNMDRSGVADAVEGKMPRALRHVPMDDPAFIRAYTNYCIWMIDRFRPDYVLSAIESNDLLKENPAAWPAFDRFSRAVMANLKARYPGILFGESLALHTFMNTDGPGPSRAYRDAIKAHIRDFDFAGISYYPFLHGALAPAQWQQAFDFIRGWTRKPLAVTETGQPGQRLRVKTWGLNLPFSEADQAAYVCTLMRNAVRGEYRFVIWFEARDIDRLIPALPRSIRDLARLFRDMGLVDETGREREGLRIWRGESAACAW